MLYCLALCCLVLYYIVLVCMQNDLFVRVWNSVSSADAYSKTAPGYVSLVHAILT